MHSASQKAAQSQPWLLTNEFQCKYITKEARYKAERSLQIDKFQVCQKDHAINTFIYNLF